MRGWAIAAGLGLALVGGPALPAAPADDDQSACLTSVADTLATPDPAAHKRRIAACTNFLQTETVPDRRAPLLAARSESYYYTKSFVRSLLDLQTLQGMPLRRPEELAYDLAVNYKGLGYFTLSLEEIERAILEGVHSARAYAVRGGDKALTGHYGEAIEDLDLAISENPSLDYAYSARGFADLEVGEVERAIADFDQAIKLNPNAGDSYYYRGKAHFALDHYDQAIADFQRAQELSSGNDAANEFIADVRATMTMPIAPPPATPPADGPSRPLGRTHNCAAYYPVLSNRLLEAGDVIIHYDVSQTGSISGVGLERSSGSDRLDRAAMVCVSRHWLNTPAYQGGVAIPTPRHLARIVFIAHPQGPTEPIRAGALIALGLYPAAIAEYTRILGADPNDADAYFRRGFANYVMHNYADAVHDLNQAINLGPGNDEAIAARELVKAAAMEQSPVHKDI